MGALHATSEADCIIRNERNGAGPGGISRLQHQPQPFQALLRRRSRPARSSTGRRAGAGAGPGGASGACSRPGRPGATGRAGVTGTRRPRRASRCTGRSAGRRGAVLGGFAGLFRSRLLAVACGERSGDGQKHDREQ